MGFRKVQCLHCCTAMQIVPSQAAHPELLHAAFEKAPPENCPECCKKKPTNTGVTVAQKKAPSAISLSLGSPPILTYLGMVLRSTLFQC